MEKNMSKFNEKFIKNYYEDRDIGYVLEADVGYPKRLQNLHNYLPFLPKIMKIRKCNKLACNLYDKSNYVAHIRTVKQALNHGLILKKVYQLIEFNRKSWLKLYIDMNSKLSTKGKDYFEANY